MDASIRQDLAGSRDDGDAAYHKVTTRLLPLLFISYVCAYMDRMNIGFAQLQMGQDLGLNPSVYGFVAGIFFVGYVLFEVPSNILLNRIGARRTIVRIMVCWGVVSIATMFVKTPFQLGVARFLLGVFEAGLFPGVIFYLKHWYPAARRARVTSLFMLAIPVSGIVVAPLSTNIVAYMHELYSLRGWQWLFLLEGLPSVILGFVAWFYLTDRPADATWLTDAQKQAIARDLERDRQAQKPSAPHALGEAFRDSKVYVMAFILFALSIGGYTCTFWLPLIIKSFGSASIIRIGLLTMIPWLAAGIAMVWIGRLSDRKRERRWHFAIALAVGAFGFMFSASNASNFDLAMLGITVATGGIFAALAVFWTVPPTYLSGPAAAAGIALINALGALGGLAGPWVLGILKSMAGNFYFGLYAVSVVMLLGCVVMVTAVPRE